LYPAKVPKNLMVCPIKLGTVGFSPFVIVTRKYTQFDGSNAYEMTGLSDEILKFVCDVMNLTTIFLEPSLELSIDPYVKVIGDLEDGLSDVLVGTVPLMPVIVTSSFDPSIPYLHGQYKLFVPFP